MYHIALELNPEQKKQLKLRATAEGQSVKAYITELVIRELSQGNEKSKEDKS